MNIGWQRMTLLRSIEIRIIELRLYIRGQDLNESDTIHVVTLIQSQARCLLAPSEQAPIQIYPVKSLTHRAPSRAQNCAVSNSHPAPSCLDITNENPGPTQAGIQPQPGASPHCPLPGCTSPHQATDLAKRGETTSLAAGNYPAKL